MNRYVWLQLFPAQSEGNGHSSHLHRNLHCRLYSLRSEDAMFSHVSVPLPSRGHYDDDDDDDDNDDSDHNEVWGRGVREDVNTLCRAQSR